MFQSPSVAGMSEALVNLYLLQMSEDTRAQDESEDEILWTS